MTTGEKIFKLRKDARITQEEFADQLGVTRQAVSKWESDVAFPETDKIIKIARLFGVSCDYLLNDGARTDTAIIDRKLRAFFGTMVALSAAIIIAGLFVALIVYFAVSDRYSSLIGLGVFAGTALAAFVCAAAGRYKFLAECNYTKDDKTYLARRVDFLLYLAVIALFCYLPAVAATELTATLTVDQDYLHTTLTVPAKLSFWLYLFSLCTFAPAGIFVAKLAALAHAKLLGESVPTTRFIHIGCVALALCCSAAATALLFYIGSGQLDIPDSAVIALLFAPAAIAVIVTSVAHRISDKTPKPLFVLQLVTSSLLLVLCFLFAFVTGIGYTDPSFHTFLYIEYAVGAMFTASAVALLVLTIKQARAENYVPLGIAALWLPACAVCGTLLIVTVFTALANSLLFAGACVYSLAVAVFALVYFAKRVKISVPLDSR